MTRIAEQLLAATASAITFSSIPGTYTHLELWISAVLATGGTQFCYLQCNGDTGANYDFEMFDASGVASAFTPSFGATSMQVMNVNGAAANVASAAVLRLPDYAGTTFQKLVLADSGDKVATSGTGVSARLRSGFWRNTAAITSLVLTPAGGATFAIGSRFTLYGLI